MGQEGGDVDDSVESAIFKDIFCAMSPPNGHCLLLFLTICLMTSGGHFLSPTSNHRYHSNHQYQLQQQENYHFLPTRPALIPAVSRLQFLPHQHAIIRRD
ncbi:hypothetical protein X798_07400, partial [Onchocerca flexuosa]